MDSFKLNERQRCSFCSFELINPDERSLLVCSYELARHMDPEPHSEPIVMNEYSVGGLYSQLEGMCMAAGLGWATRARRRRGKR